MEHKATNASRKTHISMTSSNDLEEQIDMLLSRFQKAQGVRQQWTNIWQDSYAYALPQRNNFLSTNTAGKAQHNNLYDATALDAVEQLAASVLGSLTPPWSQWFGLKPGPDLTEAQAENLAPLLEQAAKTIQAHFDRSNFIVEIHQCYLDLIVGGTAALAFEEADPGELSAFKFSAVPLSRIVLEEGEDGFLDGSFREMSLTLAQLQQRYPFAELSEDVVRQGEKDPQQKFSVLESIIPNIAGTFDFKALLKDDTQKGRAALLRGATLPASPLIAFRWLKSPGEIYGRSPVMKALPDIKTANKVVELILKNASIAVTGIWQADDDGVLNPANIELKPGTIIPKAVGSKGLSPLDMPGRFDISQLVLEDLRGRIRHALLADKLAPVASPRMTATEVLERSSEMALLLGATYGRLQSELMMPLIMRAFNILRRRGEVPDVNIDGRLVEIDFRGPLARAQGQKNVQNTMLWVERVLAMGGEAMDALDLAKTARFLGDALGVPSDLIKGEGGLLPAENLDAQQIEMVENAAMPIASDPQQNSNENNLKEEIIS